MKIEFLRFQWGSLNPMFSSVFYSMAQHCLAHACKIPTNLKRITYWMFLSTSNFNSTVLIRKLIDCNLKTKFPIIQNAPLSIDGKKTTGFIFSETVFAT